MHVHSKPPTMHPTVRPQTPRHLASDHSAPYSVTRISDGSNGNGGGQQPERQPHRKPSPDAEADTPRPVGEPTAGFATMLAALSLGPRGEEAAPDEESARDLAEEDLGNLLSAVVAKYRTFQEADDLD